MQKLANRIIELQVPETGDFVHHVIETSGKFLS